MQGDRLLRRIDHALGDAVIRRRERKQHTKERNKG